jgi:polysaccharide deacetylase 2 family uncharacterized protein YibQ
MTEQEVVVEMLDVQEAPVGVTEAVAPQQRHLHKRTDEATTLQL